MQGIKTSECYRLPMGYRQITVTTAVFLTIPAANDGQPITHIVIQCNGGNVRWRDDGVAPTATVGMTLAALGQLDYTGENTVIEFILSSGTPILDINYYA